MIPVGKFWPHGTFFSSISTEKSSLFVNHVGFCSCLKGIILVSVLSKRLKKLQKASIQGAEREYLLNLWFHTPLGQKLVAEQSECLQSVMKSKFGQHLLQLDTGLYEPLVPQAPVGCISLMALENNSAACPVIQGAPEQLPFAPDSVDHILLHHTLDYCEDPYQALRQSQNALCEGGYLIVVGFNSTSWWGLRKRFSFGSKNVLWKGRFLSANRVNDWLGLLGLEVQEHYSLLHALPIGKASVQKKLYWLDRLSQIVLPKFGGCYILVAQKRVGSVTLVGKKWPTFKTQTAVQRANIRNES